MEREGRLGRVGLVAAVVVAALVPLAAVGGGVALLLRDGGPDVAELVAGLPDVQPLPHELEQVEGTVAVGRPLVPEEGVGLRAVYRVTGDDPIAVFRAWLEQAAELTREPVQVMPWTCDLDEAPPARWCGATHGAEVELWMTERDPLLLVRASRPTQEPARGRLEQDASGPAGVIGDLEPGRAPVDELPWVLPTEGEVLVEEQGSELRLPPGTTALTPRVGDGLRSVVLFAAVDADAALADLARQARRFEGGPELTGPERSVGDGVTYHRLRVHVPAGGPSFTIAAMRAPGDPVATVYVDSASG